MGITAALLGALATVAFLSVVLRYLFGLSWWEGNYSKRAVDGWTTTHFGHGIVLYGIWRAVLIDWHPGVAIVLSIVAEAAWEMLENTGVVIEWFRRRGDEDYAGDSVANSVCDLVACCLGAFSASFFV